MSSIAELKKKMSSNSIDTLQEKMKSEKSGHVDNPNEWKPTFNKEKQTAYAKVRFLPAPPKEEDPFVKTYSHFFQGPTNKWYVENSLTTLGKGRPDPVSEMNSRLWNSGIESDKDVARKYKRSTKYYANVLVLEDPENPSNVGKVFVYKYGPAIHSFIEKAITPEFEDETPFNPFDPFGGRPFVIRLRTENNFGKYDKSSWGDICPLAESDSEIERIWNECHSLAEYIADSQFVDYDVLKNRLYDVLGPTVGSGIETVQGAVAPKTTEPTQTTTSSTKSVEEELDDNIPFDEPTQSSNESADSDELDLESLFAD